MNTVLLWKIRSVKIGPKRSYASSSIGSGSAAKRRVRASDTRVSPGGYGTLAARSSRMSLNITDNGLEFSSGGGPTSATPPA